MTGRPQYGLQPSQWVGQLKNVCVCVCVCVSVACVCVCVLLVCVCVCVCVCVDACVLLCMCVMRFLGSNQLRKCHLVSSALFDVKSSSLESFLHNTFKYAWPAGLNMAYSRYNESGSSKNDCCEVFWLQPATKVSFGQFCFVWRQEQLTRKLLA